MAVSLRVAPLALTCAFFLAAPCRAYALCLGTQLQNVSATATFQGGAGEYNPYDPTEYMQAITFSVKGGASILNCNYFVTLSAGGSGNASARYMARPDGAHLNYNVYTNASKSAVLKSVPGATASEVISGTFTAIIGAGQVHHYTIYWTIDPLQTVGADMARMQDVNLELKLYEGLLGTIFAQPDTEEITFRARVDSSVDLSLVNTGAAFNISDTTQTVDFGTLEAGEVQAFDTIVRSNDGYAITIESQNGLLMRHERAPAVNDAVPYSLKFDGQGISLPAGVPVTAITSSAVTPAAGHRFPTQFTVGTITGAEAAGEYRDVITVTVSAN